MKHSNNITELYYRIGFGECSGAESRSTDICFGSNFTRSGGLAISDTVEAQTTREKHTLNEPAWFESMDKISGVKTYKLDPSKSSDLPAFSKTYSFSGRRERGSLRWLNKAIVKLFVAFDFYTRTGIRACRYISDALNNYPATNVLNLLLSR